MTLIIGVGFIGTGFLDGYHALVTSAWVKACLPSDLPSLIPWSWVASRLYLACLLYLSYLAWRRERHLGTAGRIDQITIVAGCGAMTLLSCLFFALVTLPPAYYPNIPFHRPEEFVPALFFGLALIGYLRKGEWQRDTFEHWLVMALIVNFVAQAVFMSFSGTLFDFEFDVAHMLKKISYICVLIGLAASAANAGSYARNSIADPSEDDAPVDIPTKVSQGIGRRVVLMVSLLVVFAVGTATTIVYQGFQDALVEKDVARLNHEADLAGLRLESVFTELRNDSAYLAGIPSIGALIQSVSERKSTDGYEQHTDAYWLDDIESLFRDAFTIRPWYSAVRFFGEVDTELSPLVHISRNSAELLSTTVDREIDPEWSQTYTTLSAQSPDAHYFLDPQSTSGRGTTSTIQLRVVRLVSDRDGRPFGILVIDTEFKNLVTDLAYFGGEDSQLHLLNDRGGVLAQATPNVRANTDLTAIAPFAELEWIELLYGGQPAPIVEEPLTKRQLAVGLRRVLFDAALAHRFMVVVFTKERSAVVSATTASGSRSLIAALIVTAIALVFGWWFGRNLVTPLRHIANASTVYGIDGARLDLPVRAQDEIGVLARSMNTMIEQVEERTGQLENEVRERESAEALLRSSETRHRTVHDTIVDALITIDTKGIIQSFNPAAESIFGYDASAIIGENIKTLVPGDFRNAHDAGIKRHQETGEAHVIGQKLRSKAYIKTAAYSP